MSSLSHVLLLLLYACSLLAAVHADINANIMSVAWYAPFASGGGYCSEAISFVMALRHNVSRLSCMQHGDVYDVRYLLGLETETKNAITQLMNAPITFAVEPTIAICHSEPGAWNPPKYQTSICPPSNAAIRIGRTMFETDRLPGGWAERCNRMNYIWVPTAFHRNIFLAGGVSDSKLRIVPESVDVNFFKPGAEPWPYPLEDTKHTFRFLSIFKWEERKGWKILLEAYLKEFRNDENVSLYILSSNYHSQNDFNLAIEEFIRLNFESDQRANHPPVRLIPTGVPHASMPSVYTGADAFVLPSRGEGWGRPHVEAMSCGLPVIATAWSGPTQFMNELNSYPLRIEGLVEIPNGPFAGHQWAQPSVSHLRELMRHVFTHREEAKQRGQQARKDMVDKYCLECVNKLVVKELEEVSKTYVNALLELEKLSAKVKQNKQEL